MDALPSGGIFRLSDPGRGGIGQGCRNGSLGGGGCPSECLDKRLVRLGLCRHFIFEASRDGRNRAERLFERRLLFRSHGLGRTCGFGPLSQHVSRAVIAAVSWDRDR